MDARRIGVPTGGPRAGSRRRTVAGARPGTLRPAARRRGGRRRHDLGRRLLGGYSGAADGDERQGRRRRPRRRGRVTTLPPATGTRARGGGPPSRRTRAADARRPRRTRPVPLVVARRRDPDTTRTRRRRALRSRGSGRSPCRAPAVAHAAAFLRAGRGPYPVRLARVERGGEALAPDGTRAADQERLEAFRLVGVEPPRGGKRARQAAAVRHGSGAAMPDDRTDATERAARSGPRKAVFAVPTPNGHRPVRFAALGARSSAGLGARRRFRGGDLLLHEHPARDAGVLLVARARARVLVDLEAEALVEADAAVFVESVASVMLRAPSAAPRPPPRSTASCPCSGPARPSTCRFVRCSTSGGTSMSTVAWDRMAGRRRTNRTGPSTLRSNLSTSTP